MIYVGIDLRDKAAKDQREKQLLMNQQVEAEIVKKRKAAEAKMNQEVDFNFTERDEIIAKDKLQLASLKYDRYATGSVSLGCNIIVVILQIKLVYMLLYSMQ